MYLIRGKFVSLFIMVELEGSDNYGPQKLDVVLIHCFPLRRYLPCLVYASTNDIITGSTNTTKF